MNQLAPDLCCTARKLPSAGRRIERRSRTVAVSDNSKDAASAARQTNLARAEMRRREGSDSANAAVHGAAGRLRAILMTTCAMIAGMLPMALGVGEGGEQVAPLGRAVIGGLLFGTCATLLLLPAIFAAVQGRAGKQSASPEGDQLRKRVSEIIRRRDDVSSNVHR